MYSTCVIFKTIDIKTDNKRKRVYVVVFILNLFISNYNLH